MFSNNFYLPFLTKNLFTNSFLGVKLVAKDFYGENGTLHTYGSTLERNRLSAQSVPEVIVIGGS